MRILVDADAFPNIGEIINLAKKYQKEIILYTDTTHQLNYDYAVTKIVDKASNSVDLMIENETEKNDLVLTQDYGVATITISKGALCISPNGKMYNEANMDFLLEIKNHNRLIRKHHHAKGPRKRTKEDKINLLNKIEEILKEY